MIQELRLGNWVLIGGRPQKIDSIVSDKNMDVLYSGVNIELERGYYGDAALIAYSNPEPIPLTPEILEKAGFELLPGGHHYAYGENPLTHDYMIVVKYSVIINGFFYQNGHFHIKHLHQLQNLYFALTGQELEIEL